MTTPYFTRTVPAQPWFVLLLVAGIGIIAAATAWELHCRALGYRPGLNDSTDLWVERRRAMQPDDVVIIGASRSLFDLDLDVLERDRGKRPVQLSLVGSCVAPVLQHLAQDPSFHGTVLCDIVPGLATAPPMAPPYKNSLKALDRLRTQTPAQRLGELLAMPLERTFACLQQDDLSLAALLKRVRLPDRPGTQLPPDLPPCFSSIERDRRTRMLDRVLTDQVLRDRVRYGWLPLFTPPPKPHWIPDAAFGQFMHKLFEDRFTEIDDAVKALRSHGGRVVFLHLPSSGELKQLEDRLTPRAAVWDRILRETGAPGINVDDYADLHFDCPEWSHLSASDSLEFTRRLVPHLDAAIKAAPLILDALIDRILRATAGSKTTIRLPQTKAAAVLCRRLSRWNAKAWTRMR